MVGHCSSTRVKVEEAERGDGRALYGPGERRRRVRRPLPRGHWTIYLAADPCDDKAIASIEPTDGRYLALIKVSTDWPERSTHVKRSTVMHECIHLLHAQVDDHLRNVLADNTQISEDLWHAVYTPFKTNLEYMVDHLTSVMRRNGQLPEWPSDKRVRRYMRKHGIQDDEPVDSL